MIARRTKLSETVAPHWVSADLNIFTSAQTGFVDVDVNTVFSFGIADPYTADLNISTSAHTAFADVNHLTSVHRTPHNGVSLSASKACTTLGPP